MLKENVPAYVLIDWAEENNIVNNAYDRPWYHADPPTSTVGFYQSPCHCKAMVKLSGHVCDDGNGHVYIGQCKRCQAILWTYYGNPNT